MINLATLLTDAISAVQLYRQTRDAMGTRTDIVAPDGSVKSDTELTATFLGDAVNFQTDAAAEVEKLKDNPPPTNDPPPPAGDPAPGDPPSGT